MNSNTLYYIAAASTVLGTLGGLLERACTAGSFGYRAGVVLASLGVDLASLGKFFGGAS